MTADGTYRPSTRVTSLAEIESLPPLTVVLDSGQNVWQSVQQGLWACAMDSTECVSDELAAVAPLMVLFRPDAPQPATTDEWAERLVGLLDEHYADDGGSDEPRSVIERVIPRLLTDLGHQWDAGFAAGQHIGNRPDTTDDAIERAARADIERVLSEFQECVRWEKDGSTVTVPVADLRIAARALAAAGAGAEVDREALIAAVRPAIYDARWNRAFGRSPVLPTDQVLAEVAVDAALAARSDAATPPTCAARDDQGHDICGQHARYVVWGHLYEKRHKGPRCGSHLPASAYAPAGGIFTRHAIYEIPGAATPTEVEWGVRYHEVQGVHLATSAGDALNKTRDVDGAVIVQRTVSAWREVEGGEQRG